MGPTCLHPLILGALVKAPRGHRGDGAGATHFRRAWRLKKQGPPRKGTGPVVARGATLFGRGPSAEKPAPLFPAGAARAKPGETLSR